MKKKIYFENLDALRFICFLSVFFFHSFHTDFDYIKQSAVYQFITHRLFANGNLGVNFFFVLSGFLITYLLIAEKKLNGQINLKNFWIRRILRIWPLFFACVIFGFYIFPILKTAFGGTPEETASIGYYLTFTNNFDFIQKGLPDASVLGVLWSVAIEEQFYLVWPVILFLLPIKRYWIAFATVIGISLVFRALYNNYTMHEYHTLSCIGDMAMGALGAWAISVKDAFKNVIVRMNRPVILLLYGSIVVIFLFRQELLMFHPISNVFERIIIAMFMLMIILEQNYSENSFFKLSRSRKMSWLGTISYGLYCLHFIGILIAINITKLLGINNNLWSVVLVETSLALIFTIIISTMSYRFFETPFLKLKTRFSFITR